MRFSTGILQSYDKNAKNPNILQTNFIDFNTNFAKSRVNPRETPH